MRSTQENSTLSMRYTKTDTIRLLPCDHSLFRRPVGKLGHGSPRPRSGCCARGQVATTVATPSCRAQGPASTSDGVETAERRGWWAFAHHDGEETAVPPARYFNAYGLP